MASSHLQSIVDLLERREIKKAEVAATRLLRSALPDSERIQALVLRARARLLGERPDEAIEDLNQARSLLPGNESVEMLELTADCHLLRFEIASVGFADRGDTSLAKRLYERILTEYPRYGNLGWIYYQLGRIALADSDVDKADTLFRQSLFAPSHIPALTAFCFERLGFIAFYERRDLESACAFLDKAVFTYPASEPLAWMVQLRILRSRVLRAMNKNEQALLDAEVALSIAEKAGDENRMILAEALLAAGELAVCLPGRDRDAVSYLQQFLQVSRRPLGVDVTWSRVYEMLGDIYSEQGQFEQAISAYRNALQYNPYHPWETSLLFRIARAYYCLNSYEDTIRAVQEYISAAEQDDEASQDYRVYDVLGNAQFALGRYADALESYKTALRLAPANASDLDKIRRYQRFAQELLQA